MQNMARICPPELQIREAAEDDVAAILRVYSEAGIQDESFTPEEAKTCFQRLAAYPNCKLFVAAEDEEIVGAYSLLVMDNLAKRGRPSGVVEDVAVLPLWQGRGVGRAMMHHALDQCRVAGCYKLTLSSNEKRSAAHRFYESLGFERHGYSFLVRL